MDAIKEYLRAVDKLEQGEINLGEYEKLCKPLRDVRENAYGEWITHKMSQISYNHLITNYECSICHTWSRYHSNYCPDCGARMDLKEVEDAEIY